MIEIDGSLKSGSGTIIRDAVSLSLLTDESVRVTNIRSRRNKPGLRPQHLKVVQALAEICGGRLEAEGVGASRMEFHPGRFIKGGAFSFDIGTAGSTTLFAMAVLPPALFADEPSRFTIHGGLFQDFAPSALYLKHVTLPILKAMGAASDLRIVRPGYVPKGQGIIEVGVRPMAGTLKPFVLEEPETVSAIRGFALSSRLDTRRVSERMADSCENTLAASGYAACIEVLNDSRGRPTFEMPAVQEGACLAIWAETATGSRVGSDMSGARGRPAEFIGKEVAKQLMEDLSTKAAVDRHLADQIIPYAGLADGWSSWRIPRMTDHVESRIWLIEKILGARAETKGNRIRIKGIGYRRRG